MTILESIGRALGFNGNGNGIQESEFARLKEELQAGKWNIETLQESLQLLELTLQHADWRLLTIQASREFTRDGMDTITQLARLMKLKNPTIKRGVEIQRLYVWAQGWAVQAADEAINAVVQGFLNDERNQDGLTSHQARGEMEEALQTDGNLYFRFFPNISDGFVRVRRVEPMEVRNILCNPDDKDEPWYYKRAWQQMSLDGSSTQMIEYYPDWQYTPTKRPAALGGVKIKWATPIYHVAVNKVGRWGVSEFFAAMDWARAYKSFLENLATVWRALARYSFTFTHKGGKTGTAAAKTKLNTTVSSSSGETNPPPTTASVFIQPEGNKIEPMRTGGATMKADDGRRLLLQAVAVFGFPETFWGDANVGTMATSESLDRPTELKVKDRQALWSDIFGRILKYVVLWAVKAPNSSLGGEVGKLAKRKDGDEVTEFIEWGEDVDPTILIEFPPIIEEDVPDRVGAIVDAMTHKGQLVAQPELEPLYTRLILIALGVQDVDTVLEQIFPQGEDIEPATSEAMTEVVGRLTAAIKEMRESD